MKDKIVAVVPESCVGPGWTNDPIWVYRQKPGGGEIYRECIQPQDQTREMLILFKVLEAAHSAMVEIVEPALSQR